MVNFKNFDVINLERNNCNTHFAIIPKSKGSQTIKFNQLIVHSMRNMFFLIEKPYKNCDARTTRSPFLRT